MSGASVPVPTLPSDSVALAVFVAAADKAGKQVLVGHVLPFFAEYVYAREAIASGKYGRLIGGSFKRIISDPLWLKDFYDPRKVGGPLVDLEGAAEHVAARLARRLGLADAGLVLVVLDGKVRAHLALPWSNAPTIPSNRAAAQLCDWSAAHEGGY